MPNHWDTEEALREDVAFARQMLMRSSAEFKRALNYVPRGIPQPQKNLRIPQAGAHYTSCIEALRTAVKQLNGFMTNGKVSGRY
jgi:hypothetical protein